MENVIFVYIIVYGSDDISNIVMFDSGDTNSYLVLKDFSIFRGYSNRSFFQIYGNKVNVNIETFNIALNGDCNGSLFEFNSLNVNYIYIYKNYFYK